MYDSFAHSDDPMEAAHRSEAILLSEMDGSDLPIEDRILRLMRRISRAADVHSRQLSVREGLTGPQLVCLRELRSAGRSTPSELARRVSLSQPTITGILDRLEARGLVARERNPEDKRRVHVWLTERGLEAVSVAPQPLHARLARRLGAIPFKEQTRIERALERIVEMMEEADDAGPPPPRPAREGGGPT